MHAASLNCRSSGRHLLALVGGLIFLAVAGCSHRLTSEGARPLSGADSARPAVVPGDPAAPPLTPEAAVLRQYRAFLGALTPLSLAPVVQRPTLIDRLAVPPARTAVMASLAQADLTGEVFYGAPVALRPAVTVERSTATVRDCQDTSGNGRKARDSGEIRAHGVAAEPAVFTFQLGTDGVWRVATMSYPGGSC